MHPVDQAILHTLIYADLFDYPLTLPELHWKLITPQPVALSTLRRHLALLQAAGRLSTRDQYFFLPRRDSLVSQRLKRAQFSATKAAKAQKISRHLLRLPYVEAVFLTGAVAVGNATAADDIDILVVTAPESLYSGRFFVNSWLELHQLRRHPHSFNASDKICPNLFLTPASLAVPPSQQTLYTAHEVIQTLPLIDPHNWYKIFIEANHWVAHYLANAVPVFPAGDMPPVTPKKAPPTIETMMRTTQWAYMAKRKTREIVTAEAAYFHPFDMGHYVLNKYQQQTAHL